MSRLKVGRVVESKNGNVLIFVTKINVSNASFSGVIIGENSCYTTGRYSDTWFSDYETLSKKESAHHINELICHFRETEQINSAVIGNLEESNKKLEQENKRLEQLCMERKQGMELAYLEINRLCDKLQNSDALIQEGLKGKEALQEKVKQLTNTNENLTQMNIEEAKISENHRKVITDLRNTLREAQTSINKANASANKRSELFANEISQLTKHSLKKEKELNDKYLRLAKAHDQTKKKLKETTEVLSDIKSAQAAFRHWVDFRNGSNDIVIGSWVLIKGANPKHAFKVACCDNGKYAGKSMGTFSGGYWDACKLKVITEEEAIKILCA